MLYAYQSCTHRSKGGSPKLGRRFHDSRGRSDARCSRLIEGNSPNEDRVSGDLFVVQN